MPPRSNGWNSIVHPLVHTARERFLADAERNGAAVVVLDIPLLFETKGDARCDAVVVVCVPTCNWRVPSNGRA